MSTAIESDAYRVLADAQSALDALMSRMRFGSDNINKYAYAVKARVKNASSLVEKVDAKRISGKNNYTVYDATDLIGVRILCLWPNDLVGAVMWLLRFIEDKSEPGHDSLFSGPSINEAIKEIIIYRASTPTKYIYEECHTRVNVSFRDKLDEYKINIANIDDSKNYSSIHIVANLKSAAQDKVFPVEFQIRTALEDVWAEMDHKLFYKGEQNVAYPADIRLSRRIMLAQKQHIDAISVSTEDIRLSVEQRKRTISSKRHEKSYSIRTNEVLAGVSGASERVKQIFDKTQADVSSIYVKIDAAIKGADFSYMPQMSSDIDRLCDELGQFNEIGKSDVDVVKSRLQYYTKMEHALALFWKAKFLAEGLSDVSNSSPRFYGSASTALSAAKSECLEIYEGLSSSDNHKKDSLLWYRIANVQYELNGDPYSALESLDLSVDFMSDEYFLPNKNLYRLVIPRARFFIKWSINDNGDEEDLLASGRATEVKNILLECAAGTYKLDNFFPISDEFCNVEDAELEEIKTKNNWIFYALRYLQLGGDQNGLDDIGLTSSVIDDAVKYIVDRMEKAQTSATSIHTLMVLSQWQGKLPLALELADKLEESLSAGAENDLDNQRWRTTFRSDIESVRASGS